MASLREDIKKCGLQKNSQTDFIVSRPTGIGRTTLRYVLPVVVLSPLPQLRAPPLSPFRKGRGGVCNLVVGCQLIVFISQLVHSFDKRTGFGYDVSAHHTGVVFNQFDKPVVLQPACPGPYRRGTSRVSPC